MYQIRDDENAQAVPSEGSLWGRLPNARFKEESSHSILEGGHWKSLGKIPWRAPILIQAVRKQHRQQQTEDMGVDEHLDAEYWRSAAPDDSEGTMTILPIFLPPAEQYLGANWNVNDTSHVPIGAPVSHISPQQFDNLCEKDTAFTRAIFAAAGCTGEGGCEGARPSVLSWHAKLSQTAPPHPISMFQIFKDLTSVTSHPVFFSWLLFADRFTSVPEYLARHTQTASALVPRETAQEFLTVCESALMPLWAKSIYDSDVAVKQTIAFQLPLRTRAPDLLLKVDGPLLTFRIQYPRGADSGPAKLVAGDWYLTQLEAPPAAQHSWSESQRRGLAGYVSQDRCRSEATQV